MRMFHMSIAGIIAAMGGMICFPSVSVAQVGWSTTPWYVPVGSRCSDRPPLPPCASISHSVTEGRLDARLAAAFNLNTGSPYEGRLRNDFALPIPVAQITALDFTLRGSQYRPSAFSPAPIIAVLYTDGSELLGPFFQPQLAPPGTITVTSMFVDLLRQLDPLKFVVSVEIRFVGIQAGGSGVTDLRLFWNTVPEPSSLSLLLIGVAGLAMIAGTKRGSAPT
jgi:hypothetical protein